MYDVIGIHTFLTNEFKSWQREGQISLAKYHQKRKIMITNQIYTFGVVFLKHSIYFLRISHVKGIGKWVLESFLFGKKYIKTYWYFMIAP